MNETPLHIFFIASWLPSKIDAFEGDFILRHAEAIATIHKVSVVYIIETNKVIVPTLEVENKNNYLKIYRTYLPIQYKNWFNKNEYYAAIFELFEKIHQTEKINIIHANVHWRAGYAAYLLSKKKNIPYILTEHSSYFNTQYYKQNSVANYNFIKKYFVKKTIQNAAIILPVSAYLQSMIEQFCKPKNITPISNVVDTNLFSFQRAIAANQFIFLHASSLIPEKNWPIIKKACELLYQKNKQFQLYLYCPNNDETLTDYATKNSWLQLFNFVPYQNMPAVYASSHCLILFSQMETQGCVALESLCCGRPVITSNLPVFKEYITPNNGLQSITNTAEELCTLMQNMVENYSTFNLLEISKNAQLQFSYSTIATQISGIYTTILKR